MKDTLQENEALTLQLGKWIIPDLGRQRQEGLWGSLASQSGLIGDPQPNKEPVLKEVDGAPEDVPNST